MNKDNWGDFILIVLICATLVVIAGAAVGGCYLCERTKQVAMEKGYVEKPNIDRTGFHWEKP